MHKDRNILTVRQPHVELGHPVLERVDGHDDEHAFAARVTQEAVSERDHL